MADSGLDGVREIEKFDTVAGEYSNLHQKSISASGESVEYFARYKIGCLERLGLPQSARVLDYGCGIGSLTRLLTESFRDVTGYDPSVESISQAQSRGERAIYTHDESSLEKGAYDLIVVAGVMHHIPPNDRDAVAAKLYALLRPGGRVAVFEHNPLNPLTRRAVDACPFDDDAILLRGKEVVSILRTVGFSAVKLRYIVFFPRPLAWFRPLEPRLGFLFLGAQTYTVGVRS